MNKRLNIYIDWKLHKKIKLLAVSEDANSSDTANKSFERIFRKDRGFISSSLEVG